MQLSRLGIDVQACGSRFIDVTLANKVESMLKYAEQPKSTRVIEDSEIDLTKLFGVL